MAGYRKKVGSGVFPKSVNEIVACVYGYATAPVNFIPRTVLSSCPVFPPWQAKGDTGAIKGSWGQRQAGSR